MKKGEEEYAILNFPDYFAFGNGRNGNGGSDLIIKRGCLNSDKSLANLSNTYDCKYMCKTDNAVNYLAGQGNFRVLEIEVF